MRIDSKLGKYKLGFIISVVLLLIIIPIIYLEIQQNYEQKIQASVEGNQLFLLEKQTNIIISIISYNIQTLHDTSKLIEVILINEYASSVKTVPEFIDNIDNDDNFVVYTENFNYPYVSAYHHLMKSGPDCEFVQYAYEDKILRPDGSSLESCTEMNQFDLFLSSLLPSTSTNDFVVRLSRTINFDLNDETAFDLIATIAIDLTKFSQDIQNSINLDVLDLF